MSARGKVDDRSVQSFAAARRTLMANYDHPERLTDFCFPEVVNFNWHATGSTSTPPPVVTSLPRDRHCPGHGGKCPIDC